MDWHLQIEQIKPHVVKVTTPQGSGTGFLVKRMENRFGIATASHVVRDAIAWRQNITIHHGAFDEPLILRGIGTTPIPRLTIIHPSLDSAYVEGNLPNIAEDAFPEKPIETVPLGSVVKPGVQVGWLGFPYLVPSDEPSFFAGHVSSFGNGRYFIDGVAIPGVSGGPAFLCRHDDPHDIRILGSITAYAHAYAGQEVIPGLMVADLCSHWHEMNNNAQG